MNQDDEVERLRELVVDERARRAHAERALTDERKRSEVWRSRAEERLDTIRKLRTPRERLRRLIRRSTSPTAGSREPPTPPTSPQNIRQTRELFYPTLRIAAWQPPDWLTVAADCVDLARQPDAVTDADLVLVGGPDAGDVLGDWQTWPGRQPLVLWEPSEKVVAEWRPRLAESDLVVGDGELAGVRRIDSLVVVDPRSIRIVEPSDESVPADSRTSRREVVIQALRRSPMVWQDEVIPAELGDLVVSGTADRVRAGLLARLTAVRNHHPGVALELMAREVGIDLPPAPPLVGILLVSRRPDRVQSALEQISGLRYPRFEVVLGLHNWRATEELHRSISDLGLEEQVEVLELGSDLPLGKCLNQVAERSGASVLAKFDDDDRYGPWYLDEAVDELTTTGADLVGKATQFVHLTHSDQLLLFQPGKENRFVEYVNGPTFVMTRSAWERVRFPHRRSRVDSIFVRGLKAVGGLIRSSSRYEFVLGRYPEGHTWEATDERFLASSAVVGTGSDDNGVWLDVR